LLIDAFNSILFEIKCTVDDDDDYDDYDDDEFDFK
jgi:hypothetical protein